MGLTFLTILLLATYVVGDFDFSPLPSGPWWIYAGGVLGVVYVAFTSTIVQHLGVLTFTLISVGGQLVGSLLIDSLFTDARGADKHLLSYRNYSYLPRSACRWRTKFTIKESSHKEIKIQPIVTAEVLTQGSDAA